MEMTCRMMSSLGVVRRPRPRCGSSPRRGAGAAGSTSPPIGPGRCAPPAGARPPGARRSGRMPRRSVPWGSGHLEGGLGQQHPVVPLPGPIAALQARLLGQHAHHHQPLAPGLDLQRAQDSVRLEQFGPDLCPTTATRRRSACVVALKKRPPASFSRYRSRRVAARADHGHASVLALPVGLRPHRPQADHARLAPAGPIRPGCRRRRGRGAGGAALLLLGRRRAASTSTRSFSPAVWAAIISASCPAQQPRQQHQRAPPTTIPDSVSRKRRRLARNESQTPRKVSRQNQLHHVRSSRRPQAVDHLQPAGLARRHQPEEQTDRAPTTPAPPPPPGATSRDPGPGPSQRPLRHR